MEAVLASGVSDDPCCPTLPSPGPESSSEQLAALERKLRCLEQEKTELSRKLQGTGSRRGQGCRSDQGYCRGLAAHLWFSPRQRPCRSPQTIGSWSSCGRKSRPYRTGCQVS